MKPDDILDAIGNVDETCVKKAKEKKKLNKKVWFTVGSLAACAVLVFCLPFIFSSGFLNDSITTGSPAPDGETAIEYKDVWIYYVKEDSLEREMQYLPIKASEIFYSWKQENGIGDEVVLIDYRIESDSTTSTSEFDDEGVVKHELGDYRILNVTVSKNIEEYYNTIDSELLLESLKQTMTGYIGLEFEEYHIFFE